MQIEALILIDWLIHSFIHFERHVNRSWVILCQEVIFACGPIEYESISLIDRILKGNTTPSQSGLGGNVNQRMTPQSQDIQN